MKKLLMISMLLFSTISLAKTTTITFTDQMPTEGNLVLGVYEGGEFGPIGQKLDQNGDISHAIKAAAFTAKIDSTQLIVAPKDSDLDQILLVGLGQKPNQEGTKNSALDWQNIGGHAIQKAVDTFKTPAIFAFDTDNTDALANLAYGTKLGSYYFDKYYTSNKRIKTQAEITLYAAQATAAQKSFDNNWNPVANAIYHTRNMSNEPANIIYPQSFVDVWTDHLKGMKNVKIKTFDEKDMQKKGMGAIYGVGKGSARQPRMMVVEYMGGKKGDAPVVIVGKGITFDTGGISLKNPSNMWNMKFDMSGAASAVGTLYALAGQNAEINIVAIAALAENMPDANAQRPGDVVTSMSGKTIQIRSTDAEGRLVLADGVYYGDVTYDPALLIDLATLTGSVGRALGKDYSGLFTRHDDLVDGFVAAGKASGDEVWHLPLNDNHFKAIENEVADVMNSGPDAPGASAGAAFIGTFVREETKWVHFDIAGVAWGGKNQAHNGSPGSTGYGIRLLNEYILKHYSK
ncbi:leucyl aminopeptidase [Marinicella rhabdoformis]|uniref:leucyl aminopeptidase n=1 Tax=Marinicella rhabdoformis TaxID=2580566 RepID=UPI0015CF8EE5|nr:leucyl aminopeptidase [Marinicella rhabdoformis]